jgi:hypothetical protein
MSYVVATVEVVTETDVEVDVEDIIDQISDETIADEYNKRNLGGLAEDWDEHVELEIAHMLHHKGRKDEAYEILWRMCLVKLNKVV